MAVATDTLERIVLAALAEDVGQGDVTTDATVPADAIGTAELLVQERGVVCGLRAAETTFRALDPDLEFDVLVAEGSAIEGPARSRCYPVPSARFSPASGWPSISSAARASRLSPDGTSTRSPGLVRRSSTRKTTPGLRALEKHAVACGGGRNHRFGLDDGVLVKDNHIRATGSIAQAVESLRASTPLPIEVECDTLDQVAEALASDADAILLDNMSLDDLRSAVVLARGRARLEASGGITLDNVRAVAETGVDEISVGALTHSARSLDVSLELK